jgi:hypothetical protein
VVVLVAMAVLMLGHAGPARAVEEYPLESLLGDFTASRHARATATMADEPGYVRIDFANIADPTEPYVGRVHLGTVLQSAETGGENTAPLITVTDVSAEVPVETDDEFGQMTIFVPVVSGDMSRSLPPVGHVLLPAAVDAGGAGLEATLENILAESAQTEEAAQRAVWHWTDGLDISHDPRAMELAGIELEATPEGDDSGQPGGVPPTGEGGTTDGGGESGLGGDPWFDGTSPGGSSSSSGGGFISDPVPPGSAAAAGVVAAGLAAAAAAAGGGLSGFGSTAGAAGGAGPGGGGGAPRAPTRGAPSGAPATAAQAQAPYQPAQGGGMAPDGPAGRGGVPSPPPAPPPQSGAPTQPQTAPPLGGSPQPPSAPETAPPSDQPQGDAPWIAQRTRPDFPPPAIRPDGTWDPAAAPDAGSEPPSPPVEDDVDIDRGLYDPNYRPDRKTLDPKAGVHEIDQTEWDPYAGQREPSTDPKARIGPQPKEGKGPDVQIDIEEGEYGVDFGGRGVRISKDKDGWHWGVGDRGVGPMDEQGIPQFDASADGFSVSNRPGQASIGIGHRGGTQATITRESDGFTSATVGDENDRTIITQIRNRWGVGRQWGSADDPSRSVGGEYDTDTGDFGVGVRDRRGSVMVGKEDDTVAVGWSSARGKPGIADDFNRQIGVDTSSGDFDVQWGDIKVSVNDDLYSVGSGNRQAWWDSDNASAIYTWGPSSGARQTTVGFGDGDWMASTRIPAGKIDVDVMVNTGMRVTANEDMMPDLLTQGSEEYWVGIRNDWLTLRGGRVADDTQIWFGIHGRPW